MCVNQNPWQSLNNVGFFLYTPWHPRANHHNTILSVNCTSSISFEHSNPPHLTYWSWRMCIHSNCLCIILGMGLSSIMYWRTCYSLLTQKCAQYANIDRNALLICCGGLLKHIASWLASNPTVVASNMSFDLIQSRKPSHVSPLLIVASCYLQHT